MFAGIKKNIKTSNYYLILLLIFLLLFLSSAQDLFHNHKPDLEHHQDCPAYQLYLLFSSSFIFEYFYCCILLIFLYLHLISFKSDYSFFNKTYNSRAPPFQIKKNFYFNLLPCRISYLWNLKGKHLCLQI